MQEYLCPDGQSIYIGEDRQVYSCGELSSSVSGNDLSGPLELMVSVFGIIMIIIDVISFIVGVVDNPGPYGSLNSIVSVPIFVATTYGIVVMLHWHARCLATELPEFLMGVDSSSSTCMAGVIDGLQPRPDTDLDIIFPYRRQHPSVSVVVKNRYWERFSGTGATFVFCNQDEIRSMFVLAFFYDKRVCDIMAGAVTGAVIGGALGAWGGYIVGGAAAALCGALGPFCLIAALLVAAIVALVTSAVGTMAGGAIADELSDQPLTEEWSWEIGQLVKIVGPTVNHAEFNGAKVFWHVNIEKTELYGIASSLRPNTGYSHNVPDCEMTTFNGEGIPEVDGHVEGVNC